MSGSGTGTVIGSVSGPTAIVNMALARLGVQAVAEYQSDPSVPAQKARLFYDADRDALLRAHWWRFAKGRDDLALSADTPTNEFDYAFALPSDFIALRYIWDSDSDEPWRVTPYPHSIEGKYILTNEDSVSIIYTKRITDTAQFDPLFTKTLVCTLALDLVFPLVKLAAVGAADRLRAELNDLTIRVRQMDRAEQNLIGREARRTWLDARWNNTGVDPSRLGGT